MHDELLRRMIQVGASDLHLRSNGRSAVRINGEMKPFDDRVLKAEEVRASALAMMPAQARRIFEVKQEADFSYVLDGFRFRLNAFTQRGVVNVAIRAIPSTIPDFAALTLPSIIEKLACTPRGLVLVAGITDSGKSTTLASMLSFINRRFPKHIITIEDPIEYVHTDDKAWVSQRCLGEDTFSYSDALRHIVRQNPDVIMIGEMRDMDTMAAALRAAESGHLVLSTIHTPDAVHVVSRIVEHFPHHQQEQARTELASVLRGVIAQRLLPRKGGGGRVLTTEVMVVTPLIRTHIRDNTLQEIAPLMDQGAYYGMHTFKQSLLSLIEKDLVTLDDALAGSDNPEEILMKSQGIESGPDSAQKRL